MIIWKVLLYKDDLLNNCYKWALGCEHTQNSADTIYNYRNDNSYDNDDDDDDGDDDDDDDDDDDNDDK